MFERLFIGSGITGGPYWVAAVNDASSIVQFTRIDVSTTGTIYASGYNIIAKYDNLGNIQWARSISPAIVSDVAVDSSDNLYFIGYREFEYMFFGEPPAYDTAKIGKLSSSGSLLWTKSFLTYQDDTNGVGIALDSQGNPHFSLSGPSALVKFDSSGNSIWGRNLAGSLPLGKVSFDSLGNVYSGNSKISKFDSSGNVVWDISYFPGAGGTSGASFALDNSGNIYICLGSNNANPGYYGTLLCKIDSNLNIVWQRRIQISSNHSYPSAIALDSSGNIYITGYFTENANNFTFVVKIDPSGNLIWQRRIWQGGTTYTYTSGIKIDNNNNMHLAGYLNNVADFIFKLPTDGSLTGTYTVGGKTIIYASTTLFNIVTYTAGSLSTTTPTYNTYTTSVGGTDITTSTKTLTSNKLGIE